MIADSKITLWHFDRSKGSFKRYIYRADVHFNSQLAKNGIKQKGHHNGSRAYIRIPKAENPEVVLGDYIRCGVWDSREPERVTDLKVTEISDNCRGTNPHLRIFAGCATERS